MSDIRSYEGLYPFLAPKLRKCPKKYITQSIQLTIHKIAKRTRAYITEMVPQSLIEDQAEYYLVWCDKARIAQITSVETRSETQVDNDDPGIILPDTAYTFEEPNLLTLKDGYIPREDITSGLTVKAAIIPDVDATKIDWHFFNNYFDGIVGGVLNDLKSQPGTQWYDPAGAQLALIDLKRDRRLAMAEVNKGRTSSVSEFGA